MAVPRSKWRADTGSAGLLAELLVDGMLSCYVEWREDAAEAGEAYRRWCMAPSDESGWRFSCYMAALDQEEWSAKRYAVMMTALRDRLPRLASPPGLTAIL
jgi:hypothetical protein